MKEFEVITKDEIILRAKRLRDLTKIPCKFYFIKKRVKGTNDSEDKE